MSEYWIQAHGDSSILTSIELSPDTSAVAGVIAAFDAVNATEAAKNEYSPLLYLYDHKPEEPKNHTERPSIPLNATHFWWRQWAEDSEGTNRLWHHHFVDGVETREMCW